MQVASILSDLTSLRACVSPLSKLPAPSLPSPTPLLTLPSSQGHDEALALVRANRNLAPASSSPGTARKASVPSASTSQQQEETDPDLRRALDLVDLHSSVKVKLLQGPDVGLQRACADVEAVRRKFQGRKD